MISLIFEHPTQQLDLGLADPSSDTGCIDAEGEKREDEDGKERRGRRARKNGEEEDGEEGGGLKTKINGNSCNKKMPQNAALLATTTLYNK